MQKKLLLFISLIGLMSVSTAQLLTWTPAFPKDNDNIVITLDASKGNQGLFNYSNPDNVYVHIGVTTNLSTNGGQQWLYVNGSTGGAYGGTTPALKAVSLGNNIYQYTIPNIRAFFGVPAGETIQRIGILFRDANANTGLVRKAANTDGSDMFIPVYDNSLATRFTTPFFQPTFVRVPEPITRQVGDNISLTGIANTASNLKLFLNGTEIQSASNATTISASPVLTTAGNQIVLLEAVSGAVTRTETFQFFVTGGTVTAPLPAGVRDGINYEAGNSSATLVLYAPNKTRVSVIGEFPGSNWMEQSNYAMNKTPDGNYWWLRITGLTPGTEYAFQYLVDGTLKIAEPYAEKILDPYNNNDLNIPAATYPNLRSYPAGQTGIVSLLQTASPAYNWQVTNFQRPDKRNIVAYELLVRDFVAAHDWKTIKDSLNYLKKLGINAIEIMPFNEFEGNDSWGYNPDFYFAPDKYYGPKNSLKEFIDSCHKKGIAVIMDIALNHSFGLSPMVQLYWDAANNRPAANNPWFNPIAKHPFNVGFDMNHESLATRYFTSRVMEHWVKEYKIDGFRFDLSKGFTQVNSCTTGNCDSGNEVNGWSNYDASRVAIWKKYYDTLQLKAPGSYAILEHFAADQEEIELSNYGMLFWGNLNYNYNEASMGFISTSNFERAIHSVRNFQQPYLMSYMESHDEERLMYRNLNFGNTAVGYSTRDLNTALARMELNTAFFLTIPGPKMIWQFGELGYDFSINRCPDGTISNNCRLSPKPIRWDYLAVPARKRLYDHYSKLNQLRFHPLYKDVFIANSINITRSLGEGFKWMNIRSATDSSMLSVVGNFGLTAQVVSFTFPKSGTWYDYLQNSTITATGIAQGILLQPGEFHVYINRNLNNTVVPVDPPDPVDPPTEFVAQLFPSPVTAATILNFEVVKAGRIQVELINTMGQRLGILYNRHFTLGNHQLNIYDKINNLPGGTYLLQIYSGEEKRVIRFNIQ